MTTYHKGNEIKQMWHKGAEVKSLYFKGQKIYEYTAPPPVTPPPSGNNIVFGGDSGETAANTPVPLTNGETYNVTVKGTAKAAGGSFQIYLNFTGSPSGVVGYWTLKSITSANYEGGGMGSNLAGSTGAFVVGTRNSINPQAWMGGQGSELFYTYNMNANSVITFELEVNSAILVSIEVR